MLSHKKKPFTYCEAWRTTGLRAPTAALVLVGVGPNPLGPRRRRGGSTAGEDVANEDMGTSQGVGRKDAASRTPAPVNAAESILSIDPVPPVELRNLYAACDVLVVPSIATPTFREPWGLVVNEAMNRGLPVIATDAVGAVAGGLVRDRHNGYVVPAGDSAALAGAMRRLAEDPTLRTRLGDAGREDVRAFTYDAWAAGFSRALAGLGLSREQ